MNNPRPRWFAPVTLILFAFILGTMLHVWLGCGAGGRNEMPGLTPQQQAQANAVSACSGLYAVAPAIKYVPPIRCNDGSMCCVVDPRFNGFTMPGTITLPNVPGCPDAFPHEWNHHLRWANGDLKWWDHLDPTFCRCTSTCCPKPGRLTGECA